MPNELWIITQVGQHTNGEIYTDTVELTVEEVQMLKFLVRRKANKEEARPGGRSVYKDVVKKWIDLICKIDI